MSDIHDDGIPDFLRRTPEPGYYEHIKRITARAMRPRIKNPPKRITRRMQTGLGGVFGLKVKST